MLHFVILKFPAQFYKIEGVDWIFFSSSWEAVVHNNLEVLWSRTCANMTFFNC